MPRRPTAAREPLSRARVLAEAVALADAEGIGAVSMRHLADRLGVVPMALYKHVADKDDLLDGMVDAVIGEFRTVDPPGVAVGDSPGDPAGWKAEVRAAVLAARAAVLRHTWARRAIESRTVRTPAVLGHMEHLTTLFLGAGLTPDLTHHVMHTLGNRIWGFSPELFDAPAEAQGRRPRTSPQPDPADFPGIMAITADATARRPDATGCDEDFEFGFALDLILDAVERLREQGWSSTDGG